MVTEEVILVGSSRRRRLRHIQAWARRWLIAKSLGGKSFLKVLDKDENFCFQAYFISLEGCSLS